MARSLEEINLAFQAEQEKKASSKATKANQVKLPVKEKTVKVKDDKVQKLKPEKTTVETIAETTTATKKNSIKRNTDKIVMVLLFLIGMGIFIYPPLSDYVARRNVIQGATSYHQNTSKLSREEKHKLLTAARDYNESLNSAKVEDPFIPGSGRAIPSNYTEVLNTENGIMGYVDIPKIKVYLPIRHGSAEEALTKGAGHIEQTHLPVGGEGNLSVITAHTGFTGADMFNRLIEMQEGDTFMIHVLDETTTYEVDDISVIEPEEIEKLMPIKDKDYVTLLTCTPYGINSHRLLVRGHRIPNKTEEIQTAQEIPFPWRLVVMSGVSVVMFSTILIWNGWRDRKR